VNGRLLQSGDKVLPAQPKGGRVGPAPLVANDPSPSAPKSSAPKSSAPKPCAPKTQPIPRPIPTSPIPFIPVETPFTTKPAADIPFTTTPADSTNPKQQQKQQNKPPLTKPKRSSAFIVAALRKKKLADDLLNVTPGAGRRVQAKPAQQVPSFLSLFFVFVLMTLLPNKHF
jgi:hypothetical protein